MTTWRKRLTSLAWIVAYVLGIYALGVIGADALAEYTPPDQAVIEIKREVKAYPQPGPPITIPAGSVIPTCRGIQIEVGQPVVVTVPAKCVLVFSDGME